MRPCLPRATNGTWTRTSSQIRATLPIGLGWLIAEGFFLVPSAHLSLVASPNHASSAVQGRFSEKIRKAVILVTGTNEKRLSINVAKKNFISSVWVWVCNFFLTSILYESLFHISRFHRRNSRFVLGDLKNPIRHCHHVGIMRDHDDLKIETAGHHTEQFCHDWAVFRR